MTYLVLGIETRVKGRLGHEDIIYTADPKVEKEKIKISMVEMTNAILRTLGDRNKVKLHLHLPMDLYGVKMKCYAAENNDKDTK
jgi:hypothetical protein